MVEGPDKEPTVHPGTRWALRGSGRFLSSTVRRPNSGTASHMCPPSNAPFGRHGAGSVAEHLAVGTLPTGHW